MMSHKTIYQLVDYILLNAYSVNSTGLYNGKAGLSLSLFHIARLLNDEYVEGQALELLQEALLSTNKDISFEDGLGGIGYLLHYLIANKFIKADFKELFGEQTCRIRKTIKEFPEHSSQRMFAQHLSMVHFLDAIKNYYPVEEANHLISLIDNQFTQWLEKRFNNMKIEAGENKAEILKSVETYIKLADYYEFFSPNWNLLEKYGNLFQADKWISNLTIGYHLRNIATKHQHTYLLRIANANIAKGIKNIYPDTMSLSQHIDLLYLLYENGAELPERIRITEYSILNTNNQMIEYEPYIIDSIHSIGFIAGYQHGISRLLLYLAYKYSPLPGHRLFL